MSDAQKLIGDIFGSDSDIDEEPVAVAVASVRAPTPSPLLFSSKPIYPASIPIFVPSASRGDLYVLLGPPAHRSRKKLGNASDHANPSLLLRCVLSLYARALVVFAGRRRRRLL